MLFVYGGAALKEHNIDYGREPKDRDVFGSQSDFDGLVNALDRPRVLDLAFPQRKGIIHPFRYFHSIDFEIMPQELLDKLEALPDNLLSTFHSLPAKYVSKLTVALIKQAAWNAVPNCRERDLEDVESLFPEGLPSLGEEHQQFFDAFESRLRARYGT